jgi:SSS family solute:Na+ symporter
LAPEYLSLTNVKWYQILNWSITIIPYLVCGDDFIPKEFMPVKEKKKKKKAC